MAALNQGIDNGNGKKDVVASHVVASVQKEEEKRDRNVPRSYKNLLLSGKEENKSESPIKLRSSILSAVSLSDNDPLRFDVLSGKSNKNITHNTKHQPNERIAAISNRSKTKSSDYTF